MSSNRLILFFDGTWMNVIDETNVYLLAKNVLSHDAYGKRQKFYYSPGVGTKVLDKIPGGVAGVGLNDHLLKGYEWLCQNYDEGDEIWIFGFSRGAYTARSLSGMIRKSGLLYITNPSMLQAALKNYRTKFASAGPEQSSQNPVGANPAAEFRERFSREVKIDFLGVWDTVGALGIPYLNWLNRGLQWHDTQLSPIVKRAYHAMAIDEHREIFSSTPWVLGNLNPTIDPQISHQRFGQIADGRIVEQRWFVGSHGDVGGGCEGSKLSEIPLAWMESQAVRAGLGLRQPPVYPASAHCDPIYPSYERFGNGLYRFFRDLPFVGKGPYHRQIITDQRLTQVINPCLDPSVLERWNADPAYRPKGLGDIHQHSIQPWA